MTRRRGARPRSASRRLFLHHRRLSLAPAPAAATAAAGVTHTQRGQKRVRRVVAVRCCPPPPSRPSAVVDIGAPFSIADQVSVFGVSFTPDRSQRTKRRPTGRCRMRCISHVGRLVSRSFTLMERLVPRTRTKQIRNPKLATRETAAPLKGIRVHYRMQKKGQQFRMRSRSDRLSRSLATARPPVFTESAAIFARHVHFRKRQLLQCWSFFFNSAILVVYDALCYPFLWAAVSSSVELLFFFWGFFFCGRGVGLFSLGLDPVREERRVSRCCRRDILRINRVSPRFLNETCRHWCCVLWAAAAAAAAAATSSASISVAGAIPFRRRFVAWFAAPSTGFTWFRLDSFHCLLLRPSWPLESAIIRRPVSDADAS